MPDLPDFDALWNYNNPAETEKRFRELLPTAEQSGDASYHAQLLTQIARSQGLQHHFAEAHQTLNSVEPMLTDGLKESRVRYLLERGRVFNSSGNKVEARPLFLAAWELAGSIQADGYAVDAAHMIAIIEPPEAALEWNLKALDYAEKSVQPRARKWLGSLYNNIGWTYHDLKQYDRALEIFQKALTFREQQSDPASIRIARWCIARTLRSLNRIDEALVIQRALEKEWAEIGGKDGYVQEELGECLLIKGDSEAAQHFARAYQMLSQDTWLVENEPTRLERLKTLGEIK